MSMTKIVIEVDDTVAQKWSTTSDIYKKKISEKISNDISNFLDDDKNQKFLNYLDELGKKMKERGLTEEALNEILNDND